MAEPKWELFYWAQWKDDGKNHMMGRGEFVRVVFVEAGVEFIEHSKVDGAVPGFMFGGQNKGMPTFAVPAIRHGDFVLGQTGAILRFLGEKFGLAPATAEEKAHCDQLICTAMDFVTEGRMSFHMKEPTGSYFKQVDETKPFIEKFAAERLPKFLKHFETVLTFTNGDHLLGKTFCTADLAVFHSVCCAESQFPEAYAGAIKDLPRLAAWKDRIAARPRIAAYLKSDKRGFFEGNSMM